MFEPKTAIGLDIGDYSIKLVELRRTRGGVELSRAVFKELNGTAKDREEALREFLSQEKIKSAYVSTSVSGQSVFARYIKLPRVAQRKVTQVIKYEVQQQIPFSIDEVFWDYQLCASGGLAELEARIVAVKKDIVHNLVEILEKNQLHLNSLDATPFALYNILAFSELTGKERAGIVLDIGGKTTNILILGEGRVWTRSIPIAGSDITDALSEELGVPAEEAEAIKRKEGILLVEASAEEESSPRLLQISKVIAGVLGDMLTEISRSVSYYRTQISPVKLDYFILTGGSSRIRHIEKFFGKNLDLKPIQPDYFKHLKPAANLPELSGIKENIGVALGQALEGLELSELNIDLLPPILARQRKFRKKRGYIFLSQVLAILIVLTSSLFIGVNNRMMGQRLQTINLSLSEYEGYEKSIKELRKEIEPVRKRFNALRELSEAKSLWLNVLLDIARSLPEDMWLTEISTEEQRPEVKAEEEEERRVVPERAREPRGWLGRRTPKKRKAAAPEEEEPKEPEITLLTIAGKTRGTISSVEDFKNLLKQSGYFEEVEILHADIERSQPPGQGRTSLRSEAALRRLPRSSRREPVVSPKPEKETEPASIQEKLVIFSLQMQLKCKLIKEHLNTSKERAPEYQNTRAPVKK
jgi:type IV pilus assembly protein PilM